MYLMFTRILQNLTAEPNAVYTQRAAPIMKEDDVFEVEAIRSVPRKPNSYCEFLSFLNVGYRRYLFACLMINSGNCHENSRTAHWSQF
jgi:hypothetical protein